MADHHGKFCWYELMTTDVAAAKAFYTELVGWGAQPVPMATGEYTMWIPPGCTDGIGGVTVLPEQAKAMGAPPYWQVYVAVDDVEASAKLATELGAKTYVPPVDIPNYGRFAVLGDPWGAVFALFRGTTPDVQLADPGEALGKAGWHELVTDDVEAAVQFYGKLFGWTKTDAMDMGPEMGTYQMFGKGKVSYGGIFKRPPMVPSGAWVTYFNVPDADAAATALAGKGGKMMNGPHDVPGGGRAGVALDPQGAAFGILSKK